MLLSLFSCLFCLSFIDQFRPHIVICHPLARQFFYWIPLFELQETDPLCCFPEHSNALRHVESSTGASILNHTPGFHLLPPRANKTHDGPCLGMRCEYPVPTWKMWRHGEGGREGPDDAKMDSVTQWENASPILATFFFSFHETKTTDVKSTTMPVSGRWKKCMSDGQKEGLRKRTVVTKKKGKGK